MKRTSLGSMFMAAWAASFLCAFGCDVEQPGDEELARQGIDEEAEDVDDIVDDAEAAEDEDERPAGPDELTAAPDAAAANYFVPVGNHDVASCSTIAGWVKDGDTTAPTWVTIYRDAPYPYGEWVTTVYANLYRGDLPFADKNHGFSISTPQALKTGTTETIYIHGINVDGNGNWDAGANSPLLNNTGKTICCGAGCFGGGGGLDLP